MRTICKQRWTTHAVWEEQIVCPFNQGRPASSLTLGHPTLHMPWTATTRIMQILLILVTFWAPVYWPPRIQVTPHSSQPRAHYLYCQSSRCWMQCMMDPQNSDILLLNILFARRRASIIYSDVLLNCTSRFLSDANTVLLKTSQP